RNGYDRAMGASHARTTAASMLAGAALSACAALVGLESYGIHDGGTDAEVILESSIEPDADGTDALEHADSADGGAPLDAVADAVQEDARLTYRQVVLSDNPVGY